MEPYILKFETISLKDISQVGGKNSSLGEMFQKLTKKGINIPDGFATTAFAYKDFLKTNQLEKPITDLLAQLNTKDFSNLKEIGAKIRTLILKANIQEPLAKELLHAYHILCDCSNWPVHVAVRSSATAEDLPDASFAGQHDSYLNIHGDQKVIEACLKCYASLFTDRAIKYRFDHGFDHMKVYLSIGIQRMVRSDKACAGVCFTLDPESGNQNVTLVTGSWGLGENVVQGAVNTDEFYVFKAPFKVCKSGIISKKLGSKVQTMIYAADNQDTTIVNIDTPLEKREQYILTDTEVMKLAYWAIIIEEHYGRPMDIEWAKDGESNELFIVQARPETIFGTKKKSLSIVQFSLKEKGTILLQGKGIGNKIISGIARVLRSPNDSDLLQQGEILITEITTPDWDPILKKASAIVTDRGGRTSHAAIVAREMGALAVVGTGNATEVIKDGDIITVVSEDGINGVVYQGKLNWEEKKIDFENLEMPATEAKLILADPDQAYRLATYPNNGVGLLRMEFIITNSIQVHPMALARFDLVKDPEVRVNIEKTTAHYPDKKTYFTEKLSQAVGTIAAAFYPKEVIVRMSDFKTNEYAHLLGGKDFEPNEENPMIGFRGASRYYNPAYKEGFALECEAIRIVREEMGLTNVKVMIPFCRTLEEGKKVLQTMEEFNLAKGDNGLEVYMMTEIPSNVILAKEFAGLFDGFSIGSNDLTQLTLGLDRDSSTVSDLFNEQNPAVKQMIAMAIASARASNTPIGLCGQAPSDYPAFTEFLIRQGINSISFNPDALLNGIKHMKAAEDKIKNDLHVIDHLEI
ncbi:MAG: phosphoenolpyruvate synthase [Chitinophagaceae bacterium]|nr:phosphoenolpyruvate synthase [Chitinophagaceae bacterium]